MAKVYVATVAVRGEGEVRRAFLDDLWAIAWARETFRARVGTATDYGEARRPDGDPEIWGAWANFAGDVAGVEAVELDDAPDYDLLLRERIWDGLREKTGHPQAEAPPEPEPEPKSWRELPAQF